MSYSFKVVALNKADAKSKVAAELDRVVAGQPVHSKDRDAAAEVATKFIDMLQDDGALEVGMHGSIATDGMGGKVLGASVNVSVTLGNR